MPWSYSAITTFEKCPKRYYHTRVACDVQDEGSAATRYGTRAHEAAEVYIRDGTSLQGMFKFMEPTLEALNRMDGDKHTEFRMGVLKTNSGYLPTSFDDPDAWYRGVADLLVVNGRKGFLTDYKTSKSARYADERQLDLMAGAAFVHFPQLEKIKSSLLFVVSNEMIVKTHYAQSRDQYMSVFDDQLKRLAVARETNVWNPVSSPLCGWCPVVECAHNCKR
ncbi:MAG: hypothetical protein DDT36_00702 [Firmicutes bacterium]|nr:hypothetical protein [Bacillota bacterium]